MSLDLSNISVEDLLKALLNNPQGAAMVDSLQAQAKANEVVKPTTRYMLNKKHGYLVPATQHNWNNAELHPFNGSVFPSNTQEGLVWLTGGDAAILHLRRNDAKSASPSPRIVDDAGQEDEVVFDLNTATDQEIVDFAFSQYGKNLDIGIGTKKLKAELRALVTAANG